ncbi:MAG: hypothetical protein H7222_01720 [Methylotenera sp.]|nr:hypothetical protein [Oligoflexia bacterium]
MIRTGFSHSSLRFLPRLALALLSVSSLTQLTACGLLVGNIKPVDEKNKDYRVMDLAKANPDWKRLEPVVSANPDEQSDVKKNKEAFAAETSDVSFQSEKTASIISMNTACRERRADDSNLKAISNQLLLGIADVTQRDEKQIQIQGVPALETTIRGKLNGEPMALKTLVVHQDICVYDLMYIARPEHFDAQVADFDRFASSLRLK